MDLFIYCLLSVSELGWIGGDNDLQYLMSGGVVGRRCSSDAVSVGRGVSFKKLLLSR